MTIDDESLAKAIIERLNRIIADPAIRADVQALLAQRVPCSEATADHPTVQVDGQTMTLGVLGLLNGLCGTLEGGARDGWGRIVAHYGREGLIRFEETRP